MSIARTLAVSLFGVHGQVVEVEADISAGLPGLSFTGRADASVVESRDRIRAAVLNSGIDWPQRRITVALLPADVPKSGSRFDLALTLAILAASGVVNPESIHDVALLAELGLDGKLRPVRGILPSVIAARQAGVCRVVVARANGPEAALVDGLDVRVADDLASVVAWLTGEGSALSRADPGDPFDVGAGPDLADVSGQAVAKRGLEIGAAGGHHLYLVGPPGAGKTMLAERLPGLLPELDDAAALEVTAVHSVAGTLATGAGLLRRPPLQSPHHTASVAALVGGGTGLARPGAISLAHRGVLFLDEAPEFGSSVIEALRQPLESGEVVLARALGAVRYPARFLLVLAANPCPCGRQGRECICTPIARRRYEQKLSGPLLDRVDLRIDVAPVSRAELFGTEPTSDSSAVVAARVDAARSAAIERWGQSGWLTNSEVPGLALREARWRLPPAVVGTAEMHVERGQLSARGFDRVIKMAWTIADLEGRVAPGVSAVAEALFFRLGRGTAWVA